MWFMIQYFGRSKQIQPRQSLLGRALDRSLAFKYGELKNSR
jgi:hypothetical protein